MELDDEEYCITGLSLGLGLTGSGGNNYNIVPKKEKRKVDKHVANSLDLAFDDDEAINNNIMGERFSNLQHLNLNAKSGDNNRKKLRLTKEQSAMLENSFKLHTTLNSVQKQTLADQLKLKTRQIEVWFQNRRARTKLKQTEVDCELLKKRCERLSEENKRLKKELQELKVGPTSPLYIQLSKPPTLTKCSCDKQENPNEY